jgi:regulator of cell morphogenesis and NO signaling
MTMEVKERQVIGVLVAQDYRTASIFKSFGIDFCCKGNRTIKEVCETANIESALLIESLEKVINSQENLNTDYQSWPLDLLADYIEKKHHRYVEEKTKEIQSYLNKVCQVHGVHHPELFEIKDHFNATASELLMHMKKEELILFPFVRKMVKIKNEGLKVDIPPFGTVQNPVQMMMHEHEAEGDRFRRIAELSNNYTAPQDACNTYKVTFALLKEFENDLHLHIHLENNILFPKAIELENHLI